MGQVLRRYVPHGQIAVDDAAGWRVRPLVPEHHRLGVTELDIVANKIDLDGKFVADSASKLDGKVHPVSAVTGSGIKELSELLWQEVKRAKTRPLAKDHLKRPNLKARPFVPSCQTQVVTYD